MTAEEQVETLACKLCSKNELLGLDNITSLCKNKQIKMRFMEVVL